MFSEPTPENLLILFLPTSAVFDLDPFSNPTPRKEEVVYAFFLRQIGSLESETQLSVDPFSNPTPRKEEVVYAFFLRQSASLEDSTPGRSTGRRGPWSWSPGFPWILSRTPPPEKKKLSMHSSFVRVRLSRTPPRETSCARFLHMDPYTGFRASRLGPHPQKRRSCLCILPSSDRVTRV